MINESKSEIPQDFLDMIDEQIEDRFPYSALPTETSVRKRAAIRDFAISIYNDLRTAGATLLSSSDKGGEAAPGLSDLKAILKEKSNIAFSTYQKSHNRYWHGMADAYNTAARMIEESLVNPTEDEINYEISNQPRTTPETKNENI